jgi:hypothetical protein
MRAENQRLHIEISRLQEQLAGREELERQVSGLREELEELRSGSPIDAPAATSTGRELIRLPGQPAVIHPLSRHFRTQGKRKLRLAMIPALVVLAIASTISVGLFRSSREITSSPTETTAKTQLISEDAPVPPPVVAIPTSRAAAIEVDKKKVFKPAPRTKPSPQVVGLFEVTRSASVYRAPSEISQAVARVEPGMKVTVVGSRDGWLEIRSKYGRPPGFVRQEAVRIEQNLG